MLTYSHIDSKIFINLLDTYFYIFYICILGLYEIRTRAVGFKVQSPNH
jgi:hypothetical protein